MFLAGNIQMCLAFNWFGQCTSFEMYFIYAKGKVVEKEGEIASGVFHLLVHFPHVHMAAMGEAAPGRSQDPGASLRSPWWVHSPITWPIIP